MQRFIHYCLGRLPFLKINSINSPYEVLSAVITKVNEIILYVNEHGVGQEEQIVKNTQDIKTLQSEVTSLSNQVGEYNEIIAGVESQVDQMEGRVDYLGAKVDACYESVEVLTEEVESYDIRISNTQSEVSELYGDVNGLNEKCEELEEENSNLQSVITQMNVIMTEMRNDIQDLYDIVNSIEPQPTYKTFTNDNGEIVADNTQAGEIIDGMLIGKTGVSDSLEGDYEGKTSTTSEWVTDHLLNFKPNTTYTVFCHVHTNTLNGLEFAYLSNATNTIIHSTRSWYVGAGETGYFKQVCTTDSDISGLDRAMFLYMNGSGTGSITYDLYVLEGTYDDIEPPAWVVSGQKVTGTITITASNPITSLHNSVILSNVNIGVGETLAFNGLDSYDNDTVIQVSGTDILPSITCKILQKEED